jgi:L-alanine-DL-glutamate epimerase-like enolase superfamily enzyme
MKLRYSAYDFKLKHPFTISRHTYFSQPSVIVALQHGNFAGYGEATSNPYYQITIDKLLKSFAQAAIRLEKYHFSTPDELYDNFIDLTATNPFAMAAINNASWDLYGKMLGKRVAEIIHLKNGKTPLTSYTLGIDDERKMRQKMEALPWPIYKIKLGTGADVPLVQSLVKGISAAFRVDANCAWSEKETISNAAVLSGLGVEFIEQPLAADDTGQARCFQQSKLQLMADESCCVESDVERCVDRFHSINIKLLKCGGISPAIRMIKKARSLGMRIMIGCMSETSVGIAAAAQLLPFVDFADLDGPLLLAEDFAEGLQYDYGKLSLLGTSGLGLTHVKDLKI